MMPSCVFACLQPFYHTLVESVQAFVQAEQHSVRANLEQVTRKFILILNLLFAMPGFVDCELYMMCCFRREDNG